MRHPKCKSCGRAVIGRLHRWAAIQPLCRNCYSFRCRTTIKASNFLRKRSLTGRRSNPSSSAPKSRGFWNWLFG
jgi:hypothetical protein